MSEARAHGERVPRTRLRGGLAAFVLAVVCATAGALACRSFGVHAPAPVAADASAAMARAQALLRGGETQRDAARIELERAHALAPDWVAPRRALDELARLELRGVEALREHRAALARNDGDAAELYLAGRLEGRGGTERFERAVRTDPANAWGWHGVSWSASVRGERGEALAAARRALDLARDPWERAFFAQNVARLLAGARDFAGAADVLARVAEQDDVAPHDRIALHVLATGIALDAPDLELRARGYERGLALLHDEPLSEDEVVELSARLRRSAAIDDPEGDRLLLALSAHSSPARDRVRGRLMLDAAPSPLALELMLSGASAADAAALPARELRAARFWNGAYAEAIDGWLASVPRVILDERGLPRTPALAAVVARVRTLPARGAPAAERTRGLVELGAALVDAGWFRESRGVAAELARLDLPAALALDARALAGHELVEAVERALARIDLRDVFRALPVSPARANDPWRKLLGEPDQPARDLDGLIAKLAPAFARAHTFLGGETSVERVSAELRASPRLDFAPIGELVHPGPAFSRSDEADGLGTRGVPVGGLAAELGKLGRFALFGELLGGGGPDGTLLPAVWLEESGGEHLGVAWSGWIAYCEAAEVETRAGRAGAHISAAALHEGYWLDVDAVRGERAVWLALAQRFAPAAPDDAPAAAARVAAVLAASGLELSARDPDSRARERRASGALLGQASRVRLAVLASRAAPDGVLGSVELDELVRVTGIHEQGHLCDRARFLPLRKHLVAAFVFALECGFAPQRIQEMLEYRAQLTALCDAPDARVPLAQVLDAAEGGGNGITPHAAGYVKLLEDFLGVLDTALTRDPARFPALDGERTLVHQLHKLGSDDVRALALTLAQRKRMVR